MMGCSGVSAHLKKKSKYHETNSRLFLLLVGYSLLWPTPILYSVTNFSEHIVQLKQLCSENVPIKSANVASVVHTINHPLYRCALPFSSTIVANNNTIILLSI